MNEPDVLRRPPSLFHVGGDVGPSYLLKTFREAFPKLKCDLVSVALLPHSDGTRHDVGRQLHGLPESSQGVFNVFGNDGRKHGR